RGEILARKVGRLWRTDEAVFNAGLQEGGTRQMSESKITSGPNIAFGKPVIAGTRISVDQILAKLAGGQSIDDLLDAFPHLTRESIIAAIEFARKAVNATIQEDASQLHQAPA